MGHMETEVEDGRIVTPYGKAPPGLSQGIMSFWPYDVWTDAARLSYLESGWRYDAVNNTLWRANGQCNQRYYLDPPGIWAQTEHSVGYFQINICAHGHDEDYWKLPDHNCSKAADLYNQSGWQPWSYSAGQLGLL